MSQERKNWYNQGMRDFSYWLDIPYNPRPALTGNIDTDVVVIGGGITGVCIAYYCAKQGFKTTLIEKHELASGSAGKNGGMIVEGFTMDFVTAVESYGLDVAKEAWMQTVKARQTVQALVEEHQIDCDLSQPGSLYVASTSEEVKWYRQEAAARLAAGITCELIESGVQLRHSPFLLQLYNPDDCLIQPVKFVRGLAKAAERLGVMIYENTSAEFYDAHSAKTAYGSIKAQKVVLAMETANPNLSAFEGSIFREQALVTEPLSDEQIASMDWPKGGMLWNSGMDYINIRKIGNRFFTSWGIGLEASDSELEAQKQLQLQFVTRSFPTLKEFDLKISHRWTGLLLTPDRSRPYIGQNNGLYQACGQGTNGLTNGIISGQAMADFLSGKSVPSIYQLEI